MRSLVRLGFLMVTVKSKLLKRTCTFA